MNIRTQFEAARDRAAALAGQTDRTPAEEVELADQLDRAEQLKTELADVDARDARLAALADVSRAVAIPGTLEVASAPVEMTAGEYLAAAASHLSGDMSADEFRDRAAMYIDRADSVTTDFVGNLPQQIVGAMIELYGSARPIFNSFTNQAMPSSGRKFERPRIVQHVAVGEQVNELDALSTQKMTTTLDEVAKRTFGGTLDISRQAIDWTSPSALQMLIQDFIKVYNRATEAAAVTHLTGLATATSTWDATDTASIVDSFVQGVLDVGTAVDDDVPLTVWIDTASAAALTAPSGSNDTPTIEVVKRALDAVGNVTWVSSRRLPADTRIVGAPSLVEAYEQTHGLLSVQKPSTLGVEVAYSGYVAFHGIADGFVSIETA